LSIIDTVRGRVPVVSHVELTKSKTNEYYPSGYVVSLPEFQMSLWHAVTNSFGGDFYDYKQAIDTNAGVTISNVNFLAP
jgi:hypothetical protein